MKTIAIYGASGHGKVVANIAKLNGYDDVFFIDDFKNEYLSFNDFVSQNLSIPIALGIGDNHMRSKVYLKCLNNGIEVKTLTHPNAILSACVSVGNGTIIMANVVINVDTTIGKGCIINTACVLEHDNYVDDFSHISPNVSAAGSVNIGKYTHIGIGSCLIQGISIGRESTIGAGSVVLRDIASYTLAYGNPCEKIKDII